MLPLLGVVLLCSTATAARLRGGEPPYHASQARTRDGGPQKTISALITGADENRRLVEDNEPPEPTCVKSPFLLYLSGRSN